MNSNLLLALPAISIILGTIIYHFINKSNNLIDKKPKVKESKLEIELIYEKHYVDQNIKNLETSLIIENTDSGRILINEQLAIMRRYSNVLAIRIDLIGK